MICSMLMVISDVKIMANEGRYATQIHMHITHLPIPTVGIYHSNPAWTYNASHI